MTKKEFRNALLRGQGRCILAARRNPEQYREEVMWACGRSIAFDPQCEGSRAWFVDQLVHCYDDIQPFVQTAAQALLQGRPNGDWTIFSLSELLAAFARDGSDAAKGALEEKYRQLYASLSSGKRPEGGLFPERDDFENLCIVMAVDQKSFLNIADDIGALFRLGSRCDRLDFDWLYESRGKRYRNALRKGAESSENLACYLEKQQANENRLNGAIARDAQGTLSPASDYTAGPDSAAEEYLSRTNPLDRAEALRPFFRRPFPGDPSPILRDAESDCELLREHAWRALKQIRHPMVREFALATGKDDPFKAIPLLAKNYQPQDTAILEKLVTSLSVDFEDTTGWHGAGLAVLGMQRDGLKAPPSLLRYIYDTTYCSCCREDALRQLGKRRLLEQEMLEECLFDSSDGIRAYAGRTLKRRTRTT